MIHPTLQADCFVLGHLPLSYVLLMDDARYPWLILVPDRRDVREIYQLSSDDQVQLARESAQVGEGIMALFQGEKLNIAALGNMVPQLHIHHVVRYSGDQAWPGPVWGKGTRLPYGELARQQRIEQVCRQLSGSDCDFVAQQA
ncbi:MAG: HIT domain-containing protein [Gammaproteobacteria bacterium]|nr:HIT domain-containing protein [Gammaproteobacteria bacterium]